MLNLFLKKTLCTEVCRTYSSKEGTYLSINIHWTKNRLKFEVEFSVA